MFFKYFIRTYFNFFLNDLVINEFKVLMLYQNGYFDEIGVY